SFHLTNRPERLLKNSPFRVVFQLLIPSMVVKNSWFFFPARLFLAHRLQCCPIQVRRLTWGRQALSINKCSIVPASPRRGPLREAAILRRGRSGLHPRAGGSQSRKRKEFVMAKHEAKVTARPVYFVHSHGGLGPGFCHPAHPAEGDVGASACGSGDL